MGSHRRIRTVLYGDQQMEPSELDLLHTPALQRLYDLHQLGLTDRIFIDASHSRLHHVIGVLQQVDNILAAIASNLDDDPSKRRLPFRMLDGGIGVFKARDLANYVRTRRRAARLMGLLHDLTHGPFGHTLEDEIELHPQKHDHPDRQADAFYRLLLQYLGWLVIDSGRLDRTGPISVEEEALRAFLDAPALPPPEPSEAFLSFAASLVSPFLAKGQPFRAFGRSPGAEELEQLFRHLRFAMRALLWLDALHKDRLDDLQPHNSEPHTILPDGEYPFERLIDAALRAAALPLPAPSDRFHLQKDAFLLDVIGNTICADLLDYAKRDSHFAGLRLDYDVDRIVENFTVVSYRRPRSVTEKKKQGYSRIDPILRTAISIFSHKLRIDVPGELMNLLQVRFYVYQRVLFHPTKCVAGAMLGSAIQLIGWNEIPLHFRFIGDAVFLQHVEEAARIAKELLQAQLSGGSNDRVSVRLRHITGVLDALPTTLVSQAVRELVRARSEHLVRDVITDLDAAGRLLRRLNARRYHRSIFRLLPNAEVPQLNLDAEHIAAFFVDPERRATTEREIELRCGLPRGTVTIHCPHGGGPKKIAEILVLSTRKGAEQVYPLRNISKVDRDIFTKHEEAITALEEMYASMWRLVVSVAPPYTQQHEMINRRIGRILYSALQDEPYEQVHGGLTDEELDKATTSLTVPNDERMQEELERALAEYEAIGLPEVQLWYADGHRETRSEPYLRVADHAVRRLGSIDTTIHGYVSSGRFAASSPTEITVESLIDAAIPPSHLRGAVRDIQLDSSPSEIRPAQGSLLDEGVEEPSNESGNEDLDP
jgi:HD superfamily phosphohydrolase